MEAHPDNVPLFGGVAGAVPGVDEFEICDGLVLRKTYAHVMSPYILAFRRPEHSGQHHPAPLLGFSIDPKIGLWDSLRGVNITLGLPLIRTSADHGTAFDIAGQGVANAQSMIEAIEFARRLADARQNLKMRIAGRRPATAHPWLRLEFLGNVLLKIIGFTRALIVVTCRKSEKGTESGGDSHSLDQSSSLSLTFPRAWRSGKILGG